MGERMEEVLRRKDDQVESLTSEVTNQHEVIQRLEGEAKQIRDNVTKTIADNDNGDDTSVATGHDTVGTTHSEFLKKMQKTTETIQEREKQIENLETENQLLIRQLNDIEHSTDKIKEKNSHLETVIKEKELQIDSLSAEVNAMEKIKKKLDSDMQRTQAVLRKKEKEIITLSNNVNQ